MAEHSFNRGWGWGYVQATINAVNSRLGGFFLYFYTRLLKMLVLFVYKTEATRLRPRPDMQDQDRSLQDQDQF